MMIRGMSLLLLFDLGIRTIFEENRKDGVEDEHHHKGETQAFALPHTSTTKEMFSRKSLKGFIG